MKKFGLTAIVFAALGASSLMMGCDSDGNHVTAHDDSDLNQPISLFDTLMVPSVANLPDCDESREGRAFFVQSDNLPHLCVKGSWRSAADTTDFSITCSDGFLHAVDKVSSLPNGSIVGSPDTVFIEGFVSPISGIAQKGPFVFGTSITVTEANKEFNNETFQKAEGFCQGKGQ